MVPGGPTVAGAVAPYRALETGARPTLRHESTELQHGGSNQPRWLKFGHFVVWLVCLEELLQVRLRAWQGSLPACGLKGSMAKQAQHLTAGCHIGIEARTPIWSKASWSRQHGLSQTERFTGRRGLTPEACSPDMCNDGSCCGSDDGSRFSLF